MLCGFLGNVAHLAVSGGYPLPSPTGAPSRPCANIPPRLFFMGAFCHIPPLNWENIKILKRFDMSEKTFLEPPENVAKNPEKLKKWQELCRVKNLTQKDAPTLELLCEWYAVLSRCISDIAAGGGSIVYKNKLADIKPLPQVAVMKQASAEIRQLTKQLGLDEEKDDEEKAAPPPVLRLIQSKRKSRAQAS